MPITSHARQSYAASKNHLRESDLLSTGSSSDIITTAKLHRHTQCISYGNTE